METKDPVYEIPVDIPPPLEHTAELLKSIIKTASSSPRNTQKILHLVSRGVEILQALRTPFSEPPSDFYELITAMGSVRKLELILTEARSLIEQEATLPTSYTEESKATWGVRRDKLHGLLVEAHAPEFNPPDGWEEALEEVARVDDHLWVGLIAHDMWYGGRDLELAKEVERTAAELLEPLISEKEADPGKRDIERIMMHWQSSRTDAHSPLRSLRDPSKPSFGSLGLGSRNSRSNSPVPSRQDSPAPGVINLESPHIGKDLGGVEGDSSRRALDPVPRSRVPKAPVASGRVTDSSPGTRDSVQPSPSIPSSRTPDSMATKSGGVLDSVLGSRSPNPPPASRRVRDPSSGISDSVPSRPSTSGGRAPDPMPIRSRLVPDPDNSQGAATESVAPSGTSNPDPFSSSITGRRDSGHTSTTSHLVPVANLPSVEQSPDRDLHLSSPPPVLDFNPTQILSNILTPAALVSPDPGPPPVTETSGSLSATLDLTRQPMAILDSARPDAAPLARNDQAPDSRPTRGLPVPGRPSVTTRRDPDLHPSPVPTPPAIGPGLSPWTMPESGIPIVDPRQLGRYLTQSIKSKANRDHVEEFFYLVGMADNEQLSKEVRQGIDALVIRVVNEPQNESEVKSAIEIMNEYLESLGNSDPRRESSKIAAAWKKSKRLREGTEAKRMGEALLNQRRDETTPSEGLKEYHVRVDVRHEKKLNVAGYRICFTVPGRAQHGQVDNLVRYAAASGMVYQVVDSELRPINGKISIARHAVLYDRKSASDWDYVGRTTAIRDLQDTARLQLVNTTSETFSIAAIQQTIDDPPLEPVLFGLSHPRKVYDCLRKKNDPKYHALRSAIQLSVYNGPSNSLENLTNLENILKEKRFALIKPSPPSSILPSSYSPSSASQSHSSNLAGTSPSLTSTEFRELIPEFPIPGVPIGLPIPGFIPRFPIPQFTGTLPGTFETTESNRIGIHYSTYEGSNSTSPTSPYHSLAETLGQPDAIVFPIPATPNDGQEIVTGSSPSMKSIPVPDPYPVTRDPVSFLLPLPDLDAPDRRPVAPSSHYNQPVSSGRVPYSPPAQSSRVLNSLVASRPVPNLRSGTSDSVPSPPSTPSGRAPDPMSITSRRAPNPVPRSTVPNAPIASGRVPGSTSGTRNSDQPHPSILSSRTPDPMTTTSRRVPDSELGSRSPNPPAASRRIRDPSSGTSDSVPSGHSIPGGRSPDSMSITSHHAPGSAPGSGVSSSGVARRRVPDLDSGRSDSIRSLASPSMTSGHTPYTPSVQSGRRSNSPVPSGRVSNRHPETRDAVPFRPSTPSRAPDPTSSTNRSASSCHPVTSNPIPNTPPITGRRTSGFPPTFPTPLDLDPFPVAETPFSVPAMPDDEWPAGLVKILSSTSYPVPSPSGSAVSLLSNAPVASSSTPRNTRAPGVRDHEVPKFPSTTSLESQDTNQSTTASRTKKKESFRKKGLRWVGI